MKVFLIYPLENRILRQPQQYLNKYLQLNGTHPLIQSSVILVSLGLGSVESASMNLLLAQEKSTY